MLICQILFVCHYYIHLTIRVIKKYFTVDCEKLERYREKLRSYLDCAF